MTSLGERISRIAQNWAKAIREGKEPDQIQPDCGDLGNDLDHAVLTVWHPDLRDGRVMNLITRSECTAQSLLSLAYLNLHIFPRGTTLNERFRAYAFRSALTELTIEVKQADPPLIWTNENNLLTVSKDIWESLCPDPTSEVVTLRDQALTKVPDLWNQQKGRPDKGFNWTDEILIWAIEHARPIRTIFGDSLRDIRREALNRLVECGALKALCKGAEDLSTNDDLIRAGVLATTNADSEELIKTMEVSIGHHIELLDLFIAFIQALAYYRPTATVFRAFLYQPKDDRENRCCSLILVGKDDPGVPSYLPEPSDTLRQQAYDKVAHALQEVPIRSFEYDEPPLPPGLNNLITKWKLHQWRSFVSRIFRVSVLLSTDTHEGRQCNYVFVLGSGAIWRVIDETISHEAAGPKLPPLEFVALVRSHWSIFQQSRVAGLIEFMDIPHYSMDRRVFFSKIVRLKTSFGGSELLSKVVRDVTRADSNSLVIRTQGDGRILVYHGTTLAYEFDVKTGIENTEPEADLRTIVDKALRTCNLQEGTQRYNYLNLILHQVIEEVSDAQGEGCLVIFAPEKKRGEIEAFLGEMDREDHRMMWRRRPGHLLGIDATLLRALLILDGATLISHDAVEPRRLVYPHGGCDCDPPHCFSAVQLLSEKDECDFVTSLKGILANEHRLKRLRENLMSLDGKGSKHHGAANLTVLFWHKKKQGKISDFEIVTISADGPVINWTSKLSLD